MTEITKKEVTEIVTAVQNAYDPANRTAGGHTKFAKFSKNGVEMAWKENKEVHVEIGGVKIPVSNIDEEEISNLTANLKMVRKIAEGFPTVKPKKVQSKSLSFD